MFGVNRFCKDLNKLGNIANDLSEDEYGKKLCEAIVRLTKTNFIAGGLITAAGGVAGILGTKYVRKIKEKKKKMKMKELESTDK